MFPWVKNIKDQPWTTIMKAPRGPVRGGGQGGALHIGGGDHKNYKNRRKLAKLGKKFPWVENIKDQSSLVLLLLFLAFLWSPSPA